MKSNFYRYLLMIGVVMLTLMPQQAYSQTDNGETIENDDEDQVEMPDSMLIDSLSPDSISLPWPKAVQVHIDRLLESKMFQTSQVGMMVWDLDADSCIYQHNAQQLLRPASTMKVLTAITALDCLGGSYQFKTQLKYTGEIKDSVLNGNLYCVGGMDPRFNNDDMAAFVHSLAEMGIDTIRGSIYADKSMKDDKLYGKGWCWDDDNPKLSALLIGRKDFFMDRFLNKLHEDSIYYSGWAKEGRCPGDAFTIITRFHTIDQVLMRMMKESDNLYAEAMYYQIAASTGNHPASSKSAIAVERRLIDKIGLDSRNYKLADGSGLSLYNYLSAELETKLLRYAFKNDNIYMHLSQSLPIAGVDGTLKKRMKGTFASGNVRAKTGTLTGVISLAGYCTASNGHRLCFSIINQGIMHGKNARNFQDRVCNILCQPH